MSPRVLVATPDWVGERMAGPAIRAVNLARELARGGHQVMLAAPNTIDVAIHGVTPARLETGDARGTIDLARRHDAVVAQQLPLSAMLALAASKTRVVYDLYDPMALELMAAAVPEPRRGYDELQLSHLRLVFDTILQAGDAFICASERQRDLWLGALGALGRLDHAQHARDPSFRRLIDVVPFGLDAEPPSVGAPVLRGVRPGFDERSRVFVWGGGLWGWLDPLTVIRAVHELSRTRDDVRLVFLGVERPNSRVAETTMADRAVALARELGAHDRTVVFNRDWVPYAQRGAWLAEADVGVSAHFESLETHFAFRTRVVDYLWAGLPIVTTEGDVLGDLVGEEELGASVPAEDVSAWVAALGMLLDDEGRMRLARERVAAVRRRFEWPRVVLPLLELVSEPGRPLELSRRAHLAGVRERYLRARMSLAKNGAGATLATVWQRRFGRAARLR